MWLTKCFDCDRLQSVFKNCEGDLVVFELKSEREFCRGLKAKYLDSKMNFGTGVGCRNAFRLDAIVKANEVNFVHELRWYHAR